jgi:hypothetical protein
VALNAWPKLATRERGGRLYGKCERRLISGTRNSIIVLNVTKLSTFCPSDNSSIKVKILECLQICLETKVAEFRSFELMVNCLSLKDNLV